MQNQLIPVQPGRIGNLETLTVNGRDLHRFLELRSQFSNWVQIRIKQYGFTRDIDYSVINKKIKSSVKPITEYRLSLDMSKELAMVERNDKGREARRYFIECEKALLTGRQASQQPQALTVPLTQHLELAEEAGGLRDENAAIKDEVLSLYRERSAVRKVAEKIVYKVPVKAVELMMRYGIPNNLITEACDRDSGHVRVIKHNARKAGRLQ